MIAVIKTGGKQYKVREGEILDIEKVAPQIGEVLEFEVLLVGDDEGANVKIGTPTVPGAKVIAKIVEHGKADKVSVVKYKPKVRYRRNVGHRQLYTKVRVEKIV